MDKLSPIQEYYRYKNGIPTSTDKADISNNELHELLMRMRNEQYQHLREQDLLLNIIRNQSKPQFGREVLANIVGSAAWDGILYLGSKIFKL